MNFTPSQNVLISIGSCCVSEIFGCTYAVLLSFVAIAIFSAQVLKEAKIF